jgi:Tol biopolymer transport system component
VRRLSSREDSFFPDGRLPWGYSALSAQASQVLVSTAKGLVRWDRLSNENRLLVAGAEGEINFPGISASGNIVVFSSPNAYDAEDGNGVDDIYLYTVSTREFARVSTGASGESSNGRSLSPCMSPDGRFITYASDASNIVRGDTNGARDIFVFDRRDGTTQRVNLADDGTQGNANCHLPSLSDDGLVIAFSCEADNLVPNDTNGLIDVFVVTR